MKRRTRTRSYEPGLPPGTIRERGPDERTTLDISITDYTPGENTTRTAASPEEIAPAPEGRHRWIAVRGTPTASLMLRIGEVFSAHELILEDILSSGQRIKAEDYENLMFTVLRVLEEQADEGYAEHELSMILTGSTIITIYESEQPGFFEPIRSRLNNPDSLIRSHGIDFLYQAILDLVVDRFFPLVQSLENQAAELESRILAGTREEQMRELHVIRTGTQQLRRILWSTRDLVSRVERSTHRFLQSDTLFYFRDIHDHIVHLLDGVAALRDSANGLRELYMSGVSNRMNEVMKVLTIISTIFIPGTFVAGVYGMNFVHMPELTVAWAYPAALGVMGAVAVGMLIYFKRRGWF